MEKNKKYLFVLFISISVFFCAFFYSVINACAGQNAGEEVFFTHTHVEGSCYKYYTESCSNHTSRHGQEYKNFHCTTCGTSTKHNVEADTWYCPLNNITWQQNGFAQCITCGTFHSTWTGEPNGNHTYQRKQMVCQVPEGQKTTGIIITADNSWTNQSVLLRVNTNILYQDLINNSISYSWGSTERLVEENGTYTVNATNKGGQTITGSITINCLDKIPPVINNVIGDTVNMTQNSIPVTLDAIDAESGLAEMAFSFDGGSTYNNRCHFTVMDDVDVVCVVRDKAGNTVAKTVKRSDFPYPPPPAPIETPTSTPVSKDITQIPPTGMVESKTENTTTKTLSENKVKTPESSKKTEDQKSKAHPVKEKEDTDTDANSETSQETGTVSIHRMKEKNEIPSKASYTDTPKDDPVIDGDLEELIEESDTARSGGIYSIENWFYKYGRIIAGVILIMGSILWMGKTFWRQTAFLYCYNGGEEFRKLGLLHLKRKKSEFTLFLPDCLLDEAETPRYRLLIHKKLVKKYKDMDIVLQSEEHKLRQPLEECVDFVL